MIALIAIYLVSSALTFALEWISLPRGFQPDLLPCILCPWGWVIYILARARGIVLGVAWFLIEYYRPSSPSSDAAAPIIVNPPLGALTEEQLSELAARSCHCACDACLTAHEKMP